MSHSDTDAILATMRGVPHDETQAFDETLAYHRLRELAPDQIGQLVRRAILAEREENARLAAAIGDAIEIGPGGDFAEGYAGVAIRIAAAIRRRPQP